VTKRDGKLFEDIGYWSEIKLDIIKKYAVAYSRILSARQSLSHVYIDGFAGRGVHIARSTGEYVLGSPLNALLVRPPFVEYFLIDLDGGKVDQLKSYVGSRSDVHVLEGDCNEILLQRVFPRVKYENFRRGLCLLDPYGLHLDWGVIETAGKMGTFDLFLNFPIMDMNRNALWRQPLKVSQKGIERMNAFWGDDSWREAAYCQQHSLFGDSDDVKLGNEEVVEAFRKRLTDLAGFALVPSPLPMKNSMGSEIYYLFFASQQPLAVKIVEDIFSKYRNWSV
jgi:three-Cys-motif partner protein